MNNQTRIDSLLQMLQQEPEDEFLNYALGLEYAKEAQSYNLSEAQFKKVINNNHQYIAGYYQLGQLYELMNQKNLALEQYYLGLEVAKIQKNNKAVNEINEAIFLLED
jgi:uncharacterized protein HemY